MKPHPHGKRKPARREVSPFRLAPHSRAARRADASIDEMEAAAHHAWQDLPAHERMAAVAVIILEIYQMKEPAARVRQLQRTLVHLQRPER
jgi:acyl-CoA reductase-like NAD-dependent aldehyde dehydrogenase